MVSIFRSDGVVVFPLVVRWARIDTVATVLLVLLLPRVVCCGDEVQPLPIKQLYRPGSVPVVRTFSTAST